MPVILRKILIWVRRLPNPAILISLSSLTVSGLSLYTAWQSFKSNAEKEQLSDLLHLYGEPVDGGSVVRFGAPEKEVILLAKMLKFEHRGNPLTFFLAPASNEISVDIIKPLLMERLNYFKKSALELGESGIGKPAEASDYTPFIMEVTYIKNGKPLRDMSMYAMTYTASWKIGEAASEHFTLTGLAFCFRVPESERERMRSPDYVFVDPRIPGIIHGEVKLTFVLCGAGAGL